MKIDRSETLKWVLFGGLLLIALFFMWQFFKVVQRWFATDKTEEEKRQEETALMKKTPDIAPLPDEQGGEISVGFDPAPLASDLHKVLNEEYWTSITARPRCEVANNALELSDNELIEVYNYYKNEYDQSLKRILLDVQWSGCYFWEDNAIEQLYDRLQKLNAI